MQNTAALPVLPSNSLPATKLRRDDSKSLQFDRITYTKGTCSVAFCGRRCSGLFPLPTHILSHKSDGSITCYLIRIGRHQFRRPLCCHKQVITSQSHATFSLSVMYLHYMRICPPLGLYETVPEPFALGRRPEYRAVLCGRWQASETSWRSGPSCIPPGLPT